MGCTDGQAPSSNHSGAVICLAPLRIRTGMVRGRPGLSQGYSLQLEAERIVEVEVSQGPKPDARQACALHYAY